LAEDDDGLPRFISERSTSSSNAATVKVESSAAQAPNTSIKYQTFVHIYSATNYALLLVSSTLIDASIAASKAAVSRIPAMDDESSAHTAKSSYNGNGISVQYSRSRSSTRRKRRWRC